MTQESKSHSRTHCQLFPPCYFPPVHWFTAWQQAPNPVIDPWGWYQKQQLSSRTWIKGPDTPLALHIPVERRSSKAPIIEKKVSFQENWRQTHWRSLQNYYRNSPYFAFYEKSLETYFSQEHLYLIEWLKASIELSFECIGIAQSPTLTEAYQTASREEDDWRRSFSGKMEGSSQFTAAAYTQVYGEFTAGLSVLDLIFSTGPESILIINRGKTNSDS